MHYLVEDPSYVLAALGIATVACLVALRVSQQGKFLIRAGSLAALAVAIFAVEQFWVTDAERVEAVVYGLAKAVEASDVDRVTEFLADDVTFGMGGRTVDGSFPLRLALPMLRHTQFDFVRVSQLSAGVGDQSRRGSAEFKVMASGTFQEGGGRTPLPPIATEWSLGFREVAPGRWKVNRVNAIRLPREVSRFLLPGR